MFTVWVSFAALLSAVEGKFTPVPETSPEFQNFNTIASSANNYLEDHLLSEIQLPDLGVLPIDPVKLTDGVLGKLNTVQVLSSPGLSKRKNRDGTTTYRFDVKYGLEEVSIRYDYEVSILGLLRRNGNLTLVPEDNSFELSGIVVVGTDKSCDARLYLVSVEKFDNFKLSIAPDGFPGITLVSEMIFNYFVPKLVPLVNIAFEAETLVPGFQKKFTEYICTQFKADS